MRRRRNRRNTLAIIRQSGAEPEVVEYLRDPPTRARLVELIAAMGLPVRELIRQKGPPYEALGFDDPFAVVFGLGTG